MSTLFSAQWMQVFKDAWNNEKEMIAQLEKNKFSSVIAYGYDTVEHPQLVVVVSNGLISSIGSYNGESAQWDLRASPENWQTWMRKPPGLMGLALAYTSRKLRFRNGDYAAMIRDPQLAGSFVKSFELMGRSGG